MTRNEMNEHRAILTSAGRRGYTTEQFASPKLRAAAKAERGHLQMTRREYIELRMGRGQMNICRIDTRIEMRTERLRRHRRRVTVRVG